MAGRLITELNDAGDLQSGDYIPIARNTTTLKLSAAQLVVRSTDGSLTFGSSINTGFGATTNDCSIELGKLRTASGHAYLDFHSFPGLDFQARLIKYSGKDGIMQLANTGLGDFELKQTNSAPIRLITNSATRMTIDSGGFVGIGITNPSAALQIAGNESSSSNIILQTAQSAGYTGTNGPSFIFRHAGSPGYAKKNDVISTISSLGYSTDQQTYLSASEIKTVASDNFNATATRSADMVFSTSHNGVFRERLTIKSDGKIGIGVPNPSSSLHINPGILTLEGSGTTTEGGEIKLCRGADNVPVWSIDQIGAGTADSGSLRFFNTATSVMRMLINKDGNLFIGNEITDVNDSLYNSKVYIPGTGKILSLESPNTSTTQSHGIIIKTRDASSLVSKNAYLQHQNEQGTDVASFNTVLNSDGSSEIFLKTTAAGNRSASRSADRLRLKSDGKVHIPGSLGIGTDNPLTSLDVRGQITVGAAQGIQCAADNSNTYISGSTFWNKGGVITLTGATTPTNPGIIYFSTGTATNSEKMRLNASGALGIGTITPELKLHVAGGIKSDKEVIIGSYSRETTTEDTGGQLRLIGGNYGVIARNDGTNFSLLPTLANSSTSKWSDAQRPFTIALSTGAVTIGQRTTDNAGAALTVVGGVRASQGAPNSADNSNRGYAFGADGDTGLFSTGSGAGAGTVSLYASNQETMFADTTKVQIKKPLEVTSTISSDQEITIKNTAEAGGQLRLISGGYGVMLRNDGTNFYLLGTENTKPTGIWHRFPFEFNLASGDVKMSHRVSLGAPLADNQYRFNVDGDSYINGWYRTTENHGWYSQKWGGGWHMSDNIWIRAYGGKSVWVENTIGSNNGITVGYNGQSPKAAGLSVRESVGIGLGTQSSIVLPELKLHVGGGIKSEKEIVISSFSRETTTEDTGGQLRLIGGNYGVIARNDGTNFYLLPTAVNNSNGVWSSAQRPFMIALSTGAVTIGNRTTDNEGAALTVVGGVRASQGAPTNGDNSNRGYAFGADGDTGLFSTGSGAPGGTVSLYANGQEVMFADTTKVQVNKNLVTTSGINGMAVGNEYIAYDTVTLGTGMYRTFQIRQTDGSLRTAVEYMGGYYDAPGGPGGSNNVVLTFLHNIDHISIQATQGRANNVNSVVSWQKKDPAKLANDLPANKIAFIRSIVNGFTYHVVGYVL